MKASPLLYRPEMILALLREIAKPGTGKTQTRRLVTGMALEWLDSAVAFSQEYVAHPENHLSRHGYAGDLIWARETLRLHDNTGAWHYGACGSPVTVSEADKSAMLVWAHHKQGNVCTSIMMPRFASRITTTLTEVRIERLHDITAEDAIAEGLACLSKDGGQTFKYGIPDRDGEPGNDDHGWHWQHWATNPVIAYARLWNSIHGDSDNEWDANPWVWVLKGTPHLVNVSAFLKG